MGNGMGAPDEEMNRREELHQERISALSSDSTVGGSDPDTGGEMKEATTTEEMLENFGISTEDKTDMKQKEKISPRYGNVQKYSIEELDMETLRDEVFPALDMTESEKQAAGALVTHSGRGLTHSALAQKAGVSQSTVSRTKRAIEGKDDNPTDKQKSILRYARMNPDASLKELSKQSSYATSNVKMLLRAFRHIPLKFVVSEEEEDWGDFDPNGDEDEQPHEETKQESTETDAVEKDLNGEDVTYKYDTDGPKRKKTRGGIPIVNFGSQEEITEVLREFDQRLEDLEDSSGTDVPDDVEERLTNIENRTKGVQSVIDRLDNQQATVESYVENQIEEIKEDLGQGIEEDVLENVTTRLDRIENTLSNHKDRIKQLDVKSGSSLESLDAADKRRVIVALAENGNDELLENLLDSF